MRTWILILVMLFAPLTAVAVEAYNFTDPQQQQIYDNLTHTLRCLVCQNQSLADSNAELARDFRQQIYTQLQAGKSQDQIVEFFTQRYGEFILYKPPFVAKTLLLWLGPLVLVLVAAVVIVLVLRRRALDPQLHHEEDASIRRVAPQQGEMGEVSKGIKFKIHPKLTTILTIIILSSATALYAYLGNIKGVRALQLLNQDREVITDIAADLSNGIKTPTETIAALQKHLQKNPNSVDAWFFLGQVELGQNNFAAAETALVHAKQIAPTDTTILFALLQVEYVRAGKKFNPAIDKLAQTILAIDPQNEDLRNLLAMEAMKRKDWRGAAEQLRALLPAYAADSERGKMLRNALSELELRK